MPTISNKAKSFWIFLALSYNCCRLWNDAKGVTCPEFASDTIQVHILNKILIPFFRAKCVVFMRSIKRRARDDSHRFINTIPEILEHISWDEQYVTIS